MKNFTYFLIPLFVSMLFFSCSVKNTTTIVEETEEEVPPILFGAEMPEDHPEIETPACMECHIIEVDATSTATQRFLERKGVMEKDELWDEIVKFFGRRQSCALATNINNESYITTIDFALDPVKKVMYAVSEKGTRKLGQMKINPNIAVEYHNAEGVKINIWQCLQMRGEARVFSADDRQFDEGLKIFKPEIETEMVKRGMEMTCFTPKEILFFDILRKERGLNIMQFWER